MSRFLEHRVIEPEVMDQPGLDAQQHRQALRGLSRLNRISGSARIVASALHQIERQQQQQTESLPTGPLRILDVATGGGDLPIALTRRAQRNGQAWQIDGCDLSETALAYARHQASQQGFRDIQFFQRDAVRDALPEGYDVVVLALFLHHLERSVCVALLQNAAAVCRWLIVNDLSRSRLSYASVWLGSRLMSRSSVVHTDARLSVRAAFTREELRDMAMEAGWRDLSIRSVPPARWLMTGRSR